MSLIVVCAIHNPGEDDQEQERREYAALPNTRMYLDILRGYAIVRHFTRILSVDGFYKVGLLRRDANVGKS